eukprot:104091_1
MPDDALFIHLNQSECRLNSFSFTLTSNDATIGINHVVKVVNGDCIEICDLYDICKPCSYGIFPVLYTSNIKLFQMSMEAKTDNVSYIQSNIRVHIVPYNNFHCMMNQIVMPDDPLHILFNSSSCHFNSEYFNSNSSLLTFNLKSNDAAIGVNHVITIENNECKEICDLYDICKPCSSGITPILYNTDIETFTMSIEAKTSTVIFTQNNITVNIAPILEFNCMLDQLIMPDDALFIHLNQSECRLNSFSFTLTSNDATIGINHVVKVVNGDCIEICDLYDICKPCSYGIFPVLYTSNIKLFQMSMEAKTDNVSYIQSNIRVHIVPYNNFHCMMNQIVMPDDPLHILFNSSSCHFNSEYFNSNSSLLTFNLKSNDAAIGVNHVITIENNECKEICDLYDICKPCSSGITPILYNTDIETFTMSIEAKTSTVIFTQNNITVNIAPRQKMNCMMNQIITPGDPLFIMNLNTSKCILNSLNFTLASDDASIGINHNVIVSDGICENICDLYEICNPCSAGIIPIISTKSNTKSFTMSATAKTQNITFIQTNITVSVYECPIGSGYDNDAVLLDCNECAINSFKLIAGNEPCFECKQQNDYSCDGKSDIKTKYNIWITGYRKTENQFISLFNIQSNDEIYDVKCAPQFCCQNKDECSYLNSFEILSSSQP